MGEFRTYGIGYTGAERHMVAYSPDLFNNAFPVVVYCHGSGGDGWSEGIAGFGGEITDALCDAGFLVIGIDAGGPKVWANSTAMSAITAAITFARTNYGVKPTKCHMLGFSMGGLTSLTYANKFPANVQCVGAMNPAVDINYFHANGFSADIDAAWGGSGSWFANAVTGGYSPTQAAIAGTFSSTIPMSVWFNEDDPTVTYSLIMAFKAALLGHSYSNVQFRDNGNTGQGHSPFPTSGYEVASWFASHNPPWQ